MPKEYINMLVNSSSQRINKNLSPILYDGESFDNIIVPPTGEIPSQIDPIKDFNFEIEESLGSIGGELNRMMSLIRNGGVVGNAGGVGLFLISMSIAWMALYYATKKKQQEELKKKEEEGDDDGDDGNSIISDLFSLPNVANTLKINLSQLMKVTI